MFFFQVAFFLLLHTTKTYYYENSFKMKNHQFQTQNSMLLTANATFCAIVYVPKTLYHISYLNYLVGMKTTRF